ncbi:hypothetical protein CHLRE_23g754397v5 [Chlamydomonas reinhardtii]|uniref:Retrotransposon gag domain-containing protein n=1 Tax=Chlamydomonas reinhardtii TaxID=3055 RepID=A8JJZ9_CHLRE|nr:uncharacterized protein CHLRE_23g754397v5 [Chlamydomonas reinhardtii]PNW69709.1 hypothetical protein CHLRE_23g754397v5 [Chlamydomonas reinhardtii]|eukprot:XP_001703800.1 predicted protein [Chlamydomonas reinhardtii]
MFDPSIHNARAWLSTNDKHGEALQWTDGQKLRVARCRLGQEASVWENGESATYGEPPTWGAFKHSFISRFVPRLEELHASLANCLQEPGERVQAYADRFRHLLALLGINGNSNKQYMYQFMGGLRKKLADEVYRSHPDNLQNAIDKAIYINQGLGRLNRSVDRDGDEDREPFRFKDRYDGKAPPASDDSEKRRYGRGDKGDDRE